MDFKVLNEMDDMDKNPLVSKMELEDNIGVYDWQSFCVSMNLEEKVINIVKNGKLILVKYFESGYTDYSRLQKLMKTFYIGSFIGYVGDSQVFSRPLGMEDMIQWTLCEASNEVRFIIHLFTYKTDNDDIYDV